MRFNDANYRKLIRLSRTDNGMPQVLPRTTICGSREAESMGLISMLDYPDELIDPRDYQEVIARGHRERTFPIYHLRNTGINVDGWNQNGFGYCWTYGLTGCVMIKRAIEGQKFVRLSPFSLGWLVNWKNAGYYCDRAIAGAKERGIADIDHVPEYELNPNKFDLEWKTNALDHRPSEWWDTRRQDEASMVQQCITILDAGSPLYVAYNWWGHALLVCGILWNSSERNKIIWQLWNSHNDGIIELTGSRGVPDEAYGVRSTSLPRAA
jgi:hypothetical protein